MSGELDLAEAEQKLNETVRLSSVITQLTVPSLMVMVPPGVPAPGATGVTVAWSVTAWPDDTVEGVAVSRGMRARAASCCRPPRLTR